MLCKLLTYTSVLKHWQRSNLRQLSTKIMELPRVAVRSVPEEERIQITFTYPVDDDSNARIRRRVYNFHRLKSEELERTIARITTQVSTKTSKKKKKGSATDVSADVSVSVKLVKSEGEVDGLKVNEEAWEDGTCLQIADQRYAVQLNVPAIKSLNLPDSLVVGIPVYARAAFEFATEDKSTLVWYREVKKPHVDSKKFKTEKSETDQSEKDDDAVPSMPKDQISNVEEERNVRKAVRRDVSSLKWVEIHKGDFYIPKVEDVGHLLKVECFPSDGVRIGECVNFISKAEVTSSPGSFPFEKRHQFTQELMPPGRFRFVTYNILADCYADSEFSRDNLFPYCPRAALNIDYRKQLILKELKGYNADVICLQEVDKKVFEYDLKPVLGKLGFDGALKMKTGEVAEGTATFFRKSKFRLVERYDLSMQEALSEDPLYADIVERVGKSPALSEKLMDRTSVMQVSLLESTDSDQRQQLVVATVHLYFHPRAPHIRIIQTAICMRHIERILQELDKQGERPAVIFCGDLNAYPLAGVHDLLTKKKISAKHAEWYAGGKEEFVEDMNFDHTLDLTSACGYPLYTNYVGGYAGCLDYIYIDSRFLRTLNVVPMPSHDDVTEHTALPNPVFPSDHIALVCDLGWSGSD